MTAPATRSAECALAAQKGYEGLHLDCRQTEDIPLPHSIGILLVERCSCSCHTPKHLRPRSGR